MQAKLIMQAAAAVNKNKGGDNKGGTEMDEADEGEGNNNGDDEGDKYIINEEAEEEDKNDTGMIQMDNQTMIANFMRALGQRQTVFATEQLMMESIVDAIIRVPEQRIINYFAEMPKGQRVKMFRRLARFVHPDKNAHKFANEAFQKLFSSWRHPLPSLSSS